MVSVPLPVSDGTLPWRNPYCLVDVLRNLRRLPLSGATTHPRPSSSQELLEPDTSSQSAQDPATPESETAPELPTPNREATATTPASAPATTPASATPASAPSTEPRPEQMVRAPSVSDVSDAGSDVENKVS